MENAKQVEVDMKFKQIFIEGDLLYGLAEDGVWVAQVRTSTNNGINLKIGELLSGWEKIPLPKVKRAAPGMNLI